MLEVKRNNSNIENCLRIGKRKEENKRSYGGMEGELRI